MINRQASITKITNSLSRLVSLVELYNRVDLTDVNIHAQTFYARLLNLAYDFELVNLNTDYQNFPAIDLGDVSSSTAFQVTSNNDRDKIQDTINKFENHKLYEEYDSLKVLIITNKKNYRKDFESEKVAFNRKSDVLDVADVCRHIQDLVPEKLQEIQLLLEVELEDKVRGGSIESKEVETIIELIEYLSDDSILESYSSDVLYPDPPDPEHKVRDRFANHSDYLRTTYKELVSQYQDKLEEARNAVGFDSVRSQKIGTYLRDFSDGVLNQCGGDARNALNALVDHFGEKLGIRGAAYDRMAIKYFLVVDLFNCDVFPNRGDRNASC